MGLSTPRCVSTGPVAAATGQLTYEFVTVVGFTFTSLDHHQLVGYVTVGTEEVSVNTQLINSLTNKQLVIIKERSGPKVEKRDCKQKTETLNER